MDNTTLQPKYLKYLHGVHGRLEGLKQAKKVYEPLLAKNFNPIGLLSPIENDLSRFFSDLLSPRGSHGQGSLFLELFISCCELNQSWLELSNTRVEVEAQTFNGRRIDIKLTFGDPGAATPLGILGIENKPWAMDQENQVLDYISDFERRVGSNHLLIYLSGNGDGPTDYSTGGREFPGLKVISYKKLNDWLKDCAARSQSIRVKFFIEEFIQYVNIQFNGMQDMGEREMIVAEVIQSPDSLEAALVVSSAVPDIKNKLLHTFLEKFKKLARDQRPEWIVNIDLKSSQESKYKGISIQIKPNDSFRIRLAFEQNNCNDCLIGICKVTELSPDRPELYELISEKLSPASRSSFWPWYRTFYISNWNNEIIAWTYIQSGEMAEQVFKNLDEIYVCLKDVNRLDDLC